MKVWFAGIVLAAYTIGLIALLVIKVGWWAPFAVVALAGSCSWALMTLVDNGVM